MIFVFGQVRFNVEEELFDLYFKKKPLPVQ